MLKNLGLRIIVENSASMENASLWAQHGLCILLDLELISKSMKLIWDTGASGEVLLHNSQALHVDLDKIDQICLSHGHYDHTGGLMAVLQQMKRKVPVLGHPDIFAPKLKARPALEYIGLPFIRSQAEAAGAVFLECRGPVALAPGLFTTGEIPRPESFEKVEGFWTIRDGQYGPDIIPDDQALAAVLPDRGLVVITGCAHSGIINTIRQAQRITGVDKLYAVIGGFHLMGADRERIDATAESLRDLDPALVRPGHCTGQKAVCLLQQALGERCQPLAVGETIDL
jgi:7,8-dihydropterin-6-yl-methyl-4-(beta-D-ribofuranosyl)aminobenzene 5'-phosphate synthase